MSRAVKPLTQTALLRRRCQRILAEQKRRAKRDGVTLDYGLDDLLELALEFPDCGYCRAPVALDFQMDHMRPLARGGRHWFGNLAVCCKGCNARKGSLLDSEFRQLLALISSWPPAAQEDIRRRLMAGGRLYARNRGRKG